MAHGNRRWRIALACWALAGCPRQDLAPLNPCTVSAATTRVDQAGISKVDMLFMVDNSGSMANKQVKLSKLLPRMVNVLTSGDRYWGQTPPAGITDKQRYFTAVSSLNLAVVDSSMGGLTDDGDLPHNAPPALQNCLGLGDDGVFKDSTDVAVQGITAMYTNEFPNVKKGDVVLPPDPSCNLDAPPPYQTYDASQDHPTADELSASFSCVARVGVRGCPYEQQLEATWKAVAPSDGKGDIFTFLNGTRGHGGEKGNQGGFVRDDAILAVMEVTDEEDCSITPKGTELNSYSDDAASKFGPVKAINMRCYSEQPEKDGLVWPVERYIEGLKSLKPENPDRVIFAAIVGIPVDAAELSYDEMLALPDMQYREAMGNPGYPEISCANSKATPVEVAYPPRRLVKVAQGFGDDAVVYSICADDYAPALDKLIEKIAAKLKGNCLPRQLAPDSSGLVQCEVFELLPPTQKKCVSARGHVGDPIPRMLTSGAQTESRLACRMNQVAVHDGTPNPHAVGWYYDDFSSSLKDDCSPGEQQRIEFSFGDLPNGAGAVIDCLQPVASIDPRAKGEAAVGTRCDNQPDACKSRSDGNYALICTENTCQISCKNNPDCPPGWDCATADAKGMGPKFCQLPTCPPAPSVDQADAGE
ncbi:MAG TPA: hypothetical protein VI299_05595 [Polyangiales bacterium]